MLVTYNACRKIHKCINSCISYEQLLCCEEMLKNFQHRYKYDPDMEADYNGLLVVLELRKEIVNKHFTAILN